MSTVAIVGGVLEGLQLLDSLLQSAATVSAAVQAAQASGQAVDWTTILAQESQAEQNLLTAIEAAKAAGK
jgi:hypothetical protein